jgi:hypothetical protein
MILIVTVSIRILSMIDLIRTFSMTTVSIMGISVSFTKNCTQIKQ